MEKRKEGTYSDYELRVPIPFLLLEAKRESIGFELPAGFTDGDCQLSTVLVLGNDVQEAITQALSYCQSRGIGLGAICNGHQLVAFLANREDGVAPLSGRAVVFPSLEIVQQRFVEFWDFFSAPGLQSGALKRQLARGSASLPPERLSQRIQGYASFVSRNAFQVDLQELGGFLIQDIPAADELADEFLRECYE
ncbi:MAG TPA: hypothetical protein VFF07_04665, partial [Actinomycetota bacterium]|nr:hypothetical protein [Actinomycetota bacterium]